MPLLVVYASAGSGHRRIAEALSSFLEKQGHEVILADVLDYTPRLYRVLYSLGYSYLVCHFPRLWGFLYTLFDCLLRNRLGYNLQLFLDRLSSRGFIRFLQKNDFQAVISTHFLVNGLLGYYKRSFNPKLKFSCVVTDFGVHSYWVTPGVDMYFVACEATKKELLMHGVSKQRILISGLPVARAFLEGGDRTQLAARFGLDPGRFTCLVLTGAFGMEIMEEIFYLLKGDAQLLLVCGYNRGLYTRLKAASQGLPVQIFGLVNNIHELMSISDAVITKPGGSTIAEALAKRLPMVFISPIPGQEEKNEEVLVSMGVAFAVRDLHALPELVRGLQKDTGRRQVIRQDIERLWRTDSLDVIARNILIA